MNRYVNLGLLSHPLNWLTLFVWIVMLAVFIFAADPLLQSMYPPSQKDIKS